MTQIFPEFFLREDDRPDCFFYQQPRMVKHIDEQASLAAQVVYDDILPQEGHILDLMASCYSHLPQRFNACSEQHEVTGLGLNRKELEANSAIDHAVIHDLNRKVTLPFACTRFDAAVCTVSVQYMTNPLDTFAEVGRSLKKGAPFIVSFSNRMFHSKAILAWRSSNDCAHKRLVESYFSMTPAFGPVQTREFTPSDGDPLYTMWAYKQ